MIKGLSLVVCLVICLQLSDAVRAPRQHHNKRAFSMEFEVDPLNSARDAASNTFYYQVGTPFVRLTCSVKNPSFIPRMKIVKENVSATNETIRTEILESFEYVLNPQLQNSRYSVSNTEAYIDNVPVIKVIFTIKDLRLSDNGLYRCLFNHSYKDINLEIYKPISANDVTLTMTWKNQTREITNRTSLALKDDYSFSCKVADVYPKPTISFALNEKPISSEESSTIVDNVFHSVSANLSFLAYHSNNYNTLTCVVKSNIPSIPHTVKSTTFAVQGAEFIDNECPTTVAVKIGDKNVTISCKFFAHPRPPVSWYQKELNGAELETDSEDPLGSEYEVNTKSEERDIYKSSVTIHEIQSERDFKIFKILLGYPNLYREIKVVGEDSIEARRALGKGTSLKSFEITVLMLNFIGISLFYYL